MKHECGCDSCGAACAEEKNVHGYRFEIIKIAAAALLFGLSYIPSMSETVSCIMQAAAALLTVYGSAIEAVEKLLEKTINEDVLLVIAVIASFAIGEFGEAAAVSVLYKTGELLEDFAADRSRRSIKACRRFAQIRRIYATAIHCAQSAPKRWRWAAKLSCSRTKEYLLTGLSCQAARLRTLRL